MSSAPVSHDPSAARQRAASIDRFLFAVAAAAAAAAFAIGEIGIVLVAGGACLSVPDSVVWPCGS